jgi:hypothetical protein
MQGLLERVRFLGGDGGAKQEPEGLEQAPDDLGPLLDQDPEPSPAVRKPRNAGPRASVSARPRATRNGGKFVSKAQVQKDLADELNMWLKIWAGMWSLSDEHCAGVLNETSAVIADDFAKLAARSDWIMDKFETTSLLGDIGKTLVHSAPLIRAMWSHHGPGARAARLQEEEGEVDAVPVVDTSQYGPWRPQVA